MKDTRHSGLLACILMVGCSATEEDSMSGLREAEGFCDTWAEVACNERVVDQCAATDEDACRNAQRAFCLDLVPMGKYSNDHAMACLAAVQEAYEDAELTAAERDTVRRLSGACNRVLSGVGSEGDACEEQADCSTEAGLSCVRKPGQAMGTCEEAEVVGGGFKCSGAREVCADGFYCDGQNCIEKNREGETCSVDVPCADEFKCEVSEETVPLVDGGVDTEDPDGGREAGGDARVCIARRPIGETCEKDADCLSGVCAIGLERSVCAASVVLTATERICADLS